MGVTVKQLLATLCLKQGDAFAPCASLDAEWRVVKRAYFKAVLVHHPDKGGDAAAFQATQTAFEALREMMATGDIGVSFATSTAVSASGSATGDAQAGGEGVPSPSWEYYAEAAEASVPIYCVEPARSGRSKCSAKGAAVAHCSGGGEQPLISKGELRVGSIEGRSGGYGRWVHLHCWRLPSAIWLGLPDCSLVGSAGARRWGLRSADLDPAPMQTLSRRAPRVWGFDLAATLAQGAAGL